MDGNYMRLYERPRAKARAYTGDRCLVCDAGRYRETFKTNCGAAGNQDCPGPDCTRECWGTASLIGQSCCGGGNLPPPAPPPAEANVLPLVIGGLALGVAVWWLRKGGA